MRRCLRQGLALALFALAACDRPPAADGLREWTSADHDRSDEKEKLQAGAQATGARGPKGPPQGAGQAGGGVDALVDATWKAQCLRCHGPIGHGDGPEGPMVKAPDLTRGDWQDTIQDAEIAAVISNGKNKMPKFELPAPVVQGLVARIRASRGR